MTPLLAADAWPRAWSAAWPVALAGALASTWPVSVYLGIPWLLPAVVATVGVAALVWQRPVYGVALIMVLLPFFQTIVGGGLAGAEKPLRPLISMLIVVMAGVAVIRGAPARSRHRPWLMLAAIGFAIAMLASALAGSNPGVAASTTVYLLLALLLLFTTAQFARRPEDRDVILCGAMVGLAIAGLEGVAQHFSGVAGKYGFFSGESFVTRAEGSFGHPALFAAYLMLSIPVAAALASARGASRSLRVLAGVAVAMAVPALYFSYTRGAILGLVLGTLAWLTLTRPRLAAAALVLALPLGVVAMQTALGDRFSTYRNTSSDAALLLRTGAWDGALEVFSRHPVLGVGMSDFPRAYAAIPDDVLPAGRTPLFYDQLRADAQPWHAHNAYLTILAEGGIIGFTAFVLFAGAVITTVVRGMRVSDSVGAIVCVGIGCSILAWAAHGLVDFDTYWVSLPLFAFIGLAAAQVAGQQSSSRGASAGRAGRVEAV